jgi:hypothetical protein
MAERLQKTGLLYDGPNIVELYEKEHQQYDERHGPEKTTCP